MPLMTLLLLLLLPLLLVLLLLPVQGGMLGERVLFICGDFSNTEAKLLLGGREEDCGGTEIGEATFGDSSLRRISGVDRSDGVFSWVDKFLILSTIPCPTEEDGC